MRIIVDEDFRDSEVAVTDVESIFKDYPHISKRVLAIWGTKECREYLRKLSMNEDRNPRKENVGFPFTLALRILEVLEAHDRAFPQFATRGHHVHPMGREALPSRW